MGWDIIYLSFISFGGFAKDLYANFLDQRGGVMFKGALS